MVISGGLSVYPREAEAILDSLPGVRECSVFGVPHPDLGEAVVAAVIPMEPSAPPREAELLAEARRHLAGYKVPRAVLLLESLPRNTMGKVQKRLLRDAWRTA
jgi:malonyl-CoA/methylmalonyl-CoA synthetase